MSESGSVHAHDNVRRGDFRDGGGSRVWSLPIAAPREIRGARAAKRGFELGVVGDRSVCFSRAGVIKARQVEDGVDGFIECPRPRRLHAKRPESNFAKALWRIMNGRAARRDDRSESSRRAVLLSGTFNGGDGSVGEELLEEGAPPLQKWRKSAGIRFVPRGPHHRDDLWVADLFEEDQRCAMLSVVRMRSRGFV